jgi:predicted transcriptional regulator
MNRLPRDAIVGPQAAVLYSVLMGANSTGEVARRTHYSRTQAYKYLCDLRDRGLVDWEQADSYTGRTDGTIHAR